MSTVCFVQLLSAGSFISQGIANVPVAGLLVTFSVMTTKYGSAFAHSLPSHMLSRVMGVVVAGMAPVVVHFGGKKKQEQEVNEHGAQALERSSSSSSSSSSSGNNSVAPGIVGDATLGSLPSFLPKGIEMPSVGYAPQIGKAPTADVMSSTNSAPFVLPGRMSYICRFAILLYFHDRMV